MINIKSICTFTVKPANLQYGLGTSFGMRRMHSNKPRIVNHFKIVHLIP